MPFTSEIASTDRHSPDMTFAEALAVAMEFEQTAYQFYSDLVTRVRAEIQPLVRELAEEEKSHYELLERHSRDEKFVQYLQQRTKKPPTTEAFGEYINLPVLPEGPEGPLEDDLLEYAENRERVAFEHYGYLAELTPEGPLKELFEFLRDEEDGHTRALQSRWDDMFSIY